MKLAEVQLKLKAPKNQFNSFGKYKYRNAEDILEALKSLLDGKATVTLSDELVLIGDRYYIKAVATFKGEDTETVTAYAREEESKKGMDGSQITGAASSYARKYALNGLFAIDDTKDSDHSPNIDESLIDKFTTILNEFTDEKELKEKAVSLRNDWIKKGIKEKMAGDMINNRIIALRKK